jgi:hypothetical protein
VRGAIYIAGIAVRAVTAVRRSNLYPLDLVERDRVAGAVVEPPSMGWLKPT